MSGRQEVIHRNVLSTKLLPKGHDVFLPVSDEGNDLIAHRKSDRVVRLIQQKARWGIVEKCRKMWPLRSTDGLSRSERLLSCPGGSDAGIGGFLLTQSWPEKRQYQVARLSAGLLARCEPYRI